KGRYERDIAKLPRVDIVLVRYGLNDRGRRENFAMNFPNDLRDLVRRLQHDHAGCQVVLETVIPTSGSDGNKAINDLVREVAVPGWFADRHPNLAGYHVIGAEAAHFLAPLLRERAKSAPK